MQHRKRLIAAVVLAAVAGGGMLYAQPQPEPPPADAPAPTPEDEAENLPEVTASGEAEADLSPREMATEADKLVDEMEGHHGRVVELQGAARKAKDVIKLNCVNESMLAVKQLLNIAESAQTDLTEAIGNGDRAQQIHDYGQVKLAHERSTAERDNAENCIGDEIIFVGPTEIDVKGPPMPDDPTDDPNDAFSSDDIELERPNCASPWF